MVLAKKHVPIVKKRMSPPACLPILSILPGLKMRELLMGGEIETRRRRRAGNTIFDRFGHEFTTHNIDEEERDGPDSHHIFKIIVKSKSRQD
jgi:hypothetical protein